MSLGFEFLEELACGDVLFHHLAFHDGEIVTSVVRLNTCPEFPSILNHFEGFGFITGSAHDGAAELLEGIGVVPRDLYLSGILPAFLQHVTDVPFGTFDTFRFFTILSADGKIIGVELLFVVFIDVVIRHSGKEGMILSAISVFLGHGNSRQDHASEKQVKQEFFHKEGLGVCGSLVRTNPFRQICFPFGMVAEVAKMKGDAYGADIPLMRIWCHFLGLLWFIALQTAVADLIVFEDGMTTGKATLDDPEHISVIGEGGVKHYLSKEIVEIRFDDGKTWVRDEGVATLPIPKAEIPVIPRTPATYDTLLHYYTDALKYYHVLNVPDSDYGTLDRLVEKVRFAVPPMLRSKEEYKQALQAIHQIIQKDMVEEVDALQFTTIFREVPVRRETRGAILLCARNVLVEHALAESVGIPLYMVVAPSPYEGNGHVAARLDPDGNHVVAMPDSPANSGDFEWETTTGKPTTESEICMMAGVNTCKVGENVYLRNLSRVETVGFFFQEAAHYLGGSKKHASALPVAEIGISLYQDPISYLNMAATYSNLVFGDMRPDQAYPGSAQDPDFSLRQNQRALGEVEKGLRLDSKSVKLLSRRTELIKRIQSLEKYFKDKANYDRQLKEYEQKKADYDLQMEEYKRKKEEYDRAIQRQNSSSQ